MKKIRCLAILSLMLLTLTACRDRAGDISNVHVAEWEASEIYTDEDISGAIAVVKEYFAKNFGGCTLTEIRYPGDSHAGEFAERAQARKADEAIVLYSSFDVDSSGGDGSLNPNSTYDNWRWILVRNDGAKWQHADHGY